MAILQKKTGRQKMRYPKICLALLCAVPSVVHGSDMRFSFGLPAFGGSPGSTSYYLNQLESQKLDFENEEEPTELELFEEQLERRVLAAVASQIVGSIYGNEFGGDQVLQVGNLLISYSDVPDANGNICVSIFDGVTSSDVCLPAQ